ncbi:NAD(P)H-dependent oxidoreductase [Dyadobacter tibetensis]|uniref:NAD(P)H-dependent oxidoreductase n=1 Tax=Dyadobacter tibetensis TaxID=1211851 RepID=UPI00046F193D|nr:NAD(P)H-dependent oxidoreductase [Dyadobacter tibetensis]
MKNILIINGGQEFAHSGGLFNRTLFTFTQDFFKSREGFNIKNTDINVNYDIPMEVEKFVWADIIIYHTPIWWFQLPHGFKKYLDEVLTAGHQKGLYLHDGRSSKNPDINYGKGGLLHNTQYMVTSSWNAPKAAFTMEGEFFQQKSVDEGPLFGFHKMNEFMGMQALQSMHFHDVEKNANIKSDLARYQAHLENIFAPTAVEDDQLVH